MKIADIRKYSTAELTAESTKLREEIAELKRNLTTGEVANVRVIRHKRKDLARMLTVLGEQLTKETKKWLKRSSVLYRATRPTRQLS